MANLTGNLEVWQSNNLVEAAQSMTLNEKRLVIAAAALHDPRKPLPEKGTVTLHADDFADVFGINSRGHLYEAVKEAAERLFNRRIRQVRESPRGKGKQIIRDIRWVWMATYNPGQGTVTLGFTPDIAPHLSMLHNQFTRYKLKHIGRIGSFYGLRMYELCAQFRTAGTRFILVDDLREMLDLGDKYPRIDSLKQRVLDPAIAEVNKHSDLRVKMTSEHKGRKLIGFHFAITVEPQQELDLH